MKICYHAEERRAAAILPDGTHVETDSVAVVKVPGRPTFMIEANQIGGACRVSSVDDYGTITPIEATNLRDWLDVPDDAPPPAP